MDKKAPSERDVCNKFIAPTIAQAGWDIPRQVREEVTFPKERVVVRGKLHTRGKARRIDFALYQSLNRPIAVIEAIDNRPCPGEGMQQALDYAEASDVSFAFTSNVDGFMFRDRTAVGGAFGSTVENHLTLGQFPAPADLWARYDAQEIYFQKALHRARPCKISSEYLKICRQVDASTEVLSRLFTGATIKHLTGEKLKRYGVPTPPPDEQRRIVAKVTKLLALCDQLKARITATRAHRAQLGDALLAQAVAA